MYKSLVLVLVVLLSVAQPVWAHKVNLFAYAEGQRVFVEGYFVDGRRTQNSRVQVFDNSDALLLEGVTDEQGLFEFDAPATTDLRIVLNAGMGHQSEFKMGADELSGQRVAIKPETTIHAQDELDHSHAAENNHSKHEHAEPVAGMSVSAAAGVNTAELEAIVQHAVSEAIKPLVRELADARQQAKLSDIVGALGYLFGVLGLFAFYKARQQSKS